MGKLTKLDEAYNACIGAANEHLAAAQEHINVHNKAIAAAEKIVNLGKEEKEITYIKKVNK